MAESGELANNNYNNVHCHDCNIVTMNKMTDACMHLLLRKSHKQKILLHIQPVQLVVSTIIMMTMTTNVRITKTMEHVIQSFDQKLQA